MFKTSQKISFLHSDPGGILFFSKVFELAHIAYEQFLASFDFTKNYFFDKEFAIPIVHSEADFIKPIQIHEEIEIEIFVSDLRNSSFELTYNFLGNNEHMKAKVKTVHVMIKKETFQKTKLPGELREAMKRFTN